MSKFEILCVTMHQNDFSKLKEMNIHSDVIFANQADDNRLELLSFENHVAKLITTNTHGVGVNRNMAILYSSADILLFADDDITYYNNVEEKVLSEFSEHPDADVFIFHFDTDDSFRKQRSYSKTRKCRVIERMPWGGCRIAVRRSSLLKSNVWFTTLLGGGCIFPCGEDSLWLLEAKKKKMRFYVSKETIGKLSFETSSWYSPELREYYYYGQGAGIEAMFRKTAWLWMLYTVWRTRDSKLITHFDKFKWMKFGRDGFNKVLSYSDYCKKVLNL